MVEVGIAHDHAAVIGTEKRIFRIPVKIHVSVDEPVRLLLFPHGIRRLPDERRDDGHAYAPLAPRVDPPVLHIEGDVGGRPVDRAALAAEGEQPVIALHFAARRPAAAAVFVRVLALFGTADERARRHGERAAADLQHAADGVVEGAFLLRRGIDDGEAHAVFDVEHRVAVVALDLVPVQVEDEVGADVRHARRDDERVIHAVRDLDVGVTVLDGGDQLFDRFDFHLFGDDVFHVAVVNIRTGDGFFDVPRLREEHAQKGAQHQEQRKKAEQSVFIFQLLPRLHTPPPSAAGLSDACANSAVSTVLYPLLSASERAYFRLPAANCSAKVS